MLESGRVDSHNAKKNDAFIDLNKMKLSGDRKVFTCTQEKNNLRHGSEAICKHR